MADLIISRYELLNTPNRSENNDNKQTKQKSKNQTNNRNILKIMVNHVQNTVKHVTLTK